jgi:predicted permease
MRSKKNKNIKSRILFGIGIVLLMCYIGGLLYIYNIQEYNPYASAGADLDALIHSILFLPPTAICLILSFILHIKTKK